MHGIERPLIASQATKASQDNCCQINTSEQLASIKSERDICGRGSICSGNVKGKKIWTKRHIENVHIIAWVIKDIGWMRCWPWKVVLLTGIVVLSGSLFQVYMDARDIVNSKDSMSRTMAFKELTQSIVQSGWILGSVVWATAEVFSLNVSARYNHVYYVACEIAAWPLGFFSGVDTIIWIVILYWNCVPTTVWYRCMLEDLDCICKNQANDQYKAKLSSDNSSVELASQQDKYANKGMDELQHDDRVDLAGIPRIFPGMVKVPAGERNFKTGVISVSDEWAFTQGHTSFRELELLVLYFWVLKDFGWVMQDHWIGPPLTFWAGSMSIIFMLTSVSMVLKYKSGLSEVLHAIAILLWVAGDIIWAWGEFISSEDTHPLEFDTIQANRDFLLPPMFTPWVELPPGAWCCRFVGAWILYIDLALLVTYYVYCVYCLVKNKLKS